MHCQVCANYLMITYIWHSQVVIPLHLPVTSATSAPATATFAPANSRWPCNFSQHVLGLWPVIDLWPNSYHTKPWMMLGGGANEILLLQLEVPDPFPGQRSVKRMAMQDYFLLCPSPSQLLPLPLFLLLSLLALRYYMSILLLVYAKLARGDFLPITLLLSSGLRGVSHLKELLNWWFNSTAHPHSNSCECLLS